jgi:hypothetical protein
VNAGDITQVQQLLETQEGMRMVDDPISSQAACGNGQQSRSLQRHHLIPDSIVEYEVEDGVWWPAVVVSSIPGAEHVTVRYHRPGAQAPYGEPPLSRETKLDKKSSKLRLPSDSPKDFTALMCACMLDEEVRTRNKKYRQKHACFFPFNFFFLVHVAFCILCLCLVTGCSMRN